MGTKEDIIIISEEDAAEIRRPHRLLVRLAIAAGTLLVVSVILLTLYCTFANKEINKGFFAVFDWTDDDYELDALDSDFVSLAFQLQANHDMRHVDARAEEYLRKFYSLDSDDLFPDAIPTISHRYVTDGRYSAIEPVAANIILNRYAGDSHTVAEAYSSYWVSNGEEERFLFYRETGKNYNDPKEYWMFLPLSDSVAEELEELNKEYKEK